MAKLKTVNIGSVEVVNAYHRIDRLNYNNGSVFVSVGSYVNKADAEDGNAPFKQTEMTDSLDKLGTKADFNISKAYTEIVSKHEDFTDATDDI